MVGEMMQSLTTTILDELSSIIPARWFANDEFTFANGISESLSQLPSVIAGFFLVSMYYRSGGFG